MASTTFTVALVLSAVNSMSSVLKQSQNSLGSYSDQVKKVSAEVGRYDQTIKNLETSMNRFGQMKQNSLRDVQAGLMMAVPVEEAIRKAAEFEGVMKKVENALYDGTIPLGKQQQMVSSLEKKAMELGNATTFSNIEAAQAQLSLIKNGMEYQDVLKGGATAAMYLAQTAEIAPSAAADAVSQVTNMFQLQGSQLLKVADDINRAANASSAGVANIMTDLQQTGMAAHVLGLKVKDTTLLLGTLHNLGLGDSSGTYLNDMLINLDKITPKARKALNEMGWLEGAIVKTLKSGKIQVSGGSNSLFDANGQIRSAEIMVQKLRQVLYNNPSLKPEDMRDKTGNLLPQEEIERLLQAKNKLTSLQQLKDVFGIQGMRAAIALATPGKGSYEEMITKAERAKRIQDQVLGWQETLLGKLETLKGSWDTVMTQSGGPLTNEVGNMVSSITKAVNAVGAWANANPKLVTSTLKVIGALAGYKLIKGGAGFVLGTIGEIASGTAGTILKMARYSHGFYDTFKYFRQGSGIFRSLWSAVAFGNTPMTRAITTATRFGGRLVTLGGQALATGGRMASAWVIGLGPVGWVIGGVTLAVIAGVAAWKTNFLGFRDFVMGIVEKIVATINRIRNALGMTAMQFGSPTPASMGSFKMMEYQKPSVVRPGSSSSDNRKYTFNIRSTDPKGAASEVSKTMGGPNVDKYVASRDPRFGDFAFSR